MPWRVKKKGDRWYVIKSDNGKVVPGGCHESHEKAQAHMRAIYANYRGQRK